MDLRVRTTLPAAVTTPAAARAVVRDVVERGRGSVRVEDVALVVSELVTNAVLHGEGDVTLDVLVAPHTVHVEVADAGPQRPAAQERSADAEAGRGLLLVSRIATDWGVRPAELGPGHGKVVWADLAAS